jgi:hypothetical protein
MNPRSPCRSVSLFSCLSQFVWQPWKDTIQTTRTPHPNTSKIDGGEAFDLSESLFVLIPIPSCCSYQPQTPVYALASSLLKRSSKRRAMGAGDSTCCAVFLKRPTSFSAIPFWLKGAVFSAIILP